jgi:hypothetical protein
MKMYLQQVLGKIIYCCRQGTLLNKNQRISDFPTIETLGVGYRSGSGTASKKSDPDRHQKLCL